MTLDEFKKKRNNKKRNSNDDNDDRNLQKEYHPKTKKELMLEESERLARKRLEKEYFETKHVQQDDGPEL